MSISNTAELDAAIEKLEKTKKIQEQELVTTFHETVESLRPVNIIKSSLGKIASPEILGNVLKTASSIGIGLLTSKIAGAGAAASGAKSIWSTVLKQSAASTVINNLDKVKAYGQAIYNNIFVNKKNGSQ